LVTLLLHSARLLLLSKHCDATESSKHKLKRCSATTAMKGLVLLVQDIISTYTA
jgi:hypothetical protein